MNNKLNTVCSSIGKRIVCLQGTGDIGKAGTIIALIERLLPRSMELPVWNIPELPPPQDELEAPLNVEVWVNGFHIGIDTEADYPYKLEENLTLLIEHECNLIFCTCRNHGYGPEFVKNIANKTGYSLVFTAPYTIKTDHTPTDEKAMQRKKAEYLEMFITSAYT